MKKVDIAIASYNGSKYISEQLESIVNQDGFDSMVHKVILSDDSSVDNTIEMFNSFKFPRASVGNNTFRPGPVGNFFSALQQSESDYVMFCDQDDFWYADKVSTFLKAAEKLNPEYPGVIYSNLELVDADLNSLGVTFFDNERIPFDWGLSAENLVLQNVAPGCAMLVNRKCIDIMLETYSDKIMMHDWWALLISALADNVIVLNTPLVKYRQHDGNAVGASKSAGVLGIVKKIQKSKVNLTNTIEQAKYLRELYQDEKYSKYRVKPFPTLVDILAKEKTLATRISLLFYKGKMKSTLEREVLTRIFLL